MSDWHQIEAHGQELTITFSPKAPDRFWPPEILRERPLAVGEASGRTAVLTGPGANWMYAHAAAVLRASRASSLRVDTPSPPGTSDDLQGSECHLVTTDAGSERGALLTVTLRSSPLLSPVAIHRLVDPKLQELSRFRPREFAISGRASVEVYAHAAWTAIGCGVQRILCWSARDGLIVVYDSDPNQIGRSIHRPDWVARAMPRPVAPVIVGVTGDPNRGKSVFSAALDVYRAHLGCDGWRLDCDGQSPTPPWFLSMVGHALEGDAKRLRDEQKRPWTPDMEASVVHQLREARQIFSILIADLPGGNHKLRPPERVPAGRERIFAEVDALVLLDRMDDPSEAAWREALRPHGLDRRIAAVLMSRNPQGVPALSVRDEGDLWRGEVQGLDRSRSAGEFDAPFRSGLERLWPALLDFARRTRETA